MELSHIRSFVILGKELHFHKAAEKLFISQPGLSKRIRQLEDTLGVQLLRRHTRKVELTHSGAYLLKECEKLIYHIDRIHSQIKIVEEGSEGEIRIGFVGSAMQKLIPDLVMNSNISFPKISFSLEEMSISRQIDALQQDRIDIGFVRLDKVSRGLEILPVYEEPFALVLPQDHHINKYNFKGLHQLKDESFILFSSEYSSTYYYNKIMSIFDDAGFVPKVSNRSINANIIFKLVGNGFGLAIVPRSLATDFNLPFRLIELEDIEQRAVLSVVYKKKGNSNLVKNVLSVINGIQK